MSGEYDKKLEGVKSIEDFLWEKLYYIAQEVVHHDVHIAVIDNICLW